MKLSLKWYQTGLERTKSLDVQDYRTEAQRFANGIGCIVMWREADVPGKRWKYMKPERMR